MGSLGLSKEMWDPYSVLEVNPNDPHCTCVGTASSTGRRCRWPFYTEQFSAYQKDTAVDILRSMSATHPSKVTTAALCSLARNTLCRDFGHQRQADAISTEWKAKIEDYLRLGRQLQNGITKDKDASEQEIKKMHETVRAVEILTADLKASQTRCSDLTAKRKEDQNTYSWDVTRLRQQLTDFRATAKALDERNNEVQNLKMQLEGRDANHEKEMKTLRESKARLETSNIREIDNLKAKVRHRDKMLDERASTSEREADGLRQQLEASNREVVALKEAKASSDEIAKSSEKEANNVRQELEKTIARHEAAVAKSFEDSKLSDQKLAASNHEVMALKEAKASSDEISKSSEQEANNVRQELEKTIARHEAAVAKSSQDSKLADQKLAASTHEIVALKEAKTSSDEKADSLQKETENVRQQLRDSIARHEALATKSTQDTKRRAQELDALNRKHAESKDENATQTARVRERDRRIEQLEEQGRALGQELARRDRHVDDLGKEVEVVKGELAEREETLSALLPGNVKRGLFAVVSRRPPRVLVRKISKIMRMESAPYVQSAA